MNDSPYGDQRIFPYLVQYFNNMLEISVNRWMSLPIFVQVVAGLVASAKDITYIFVQFVEKLDLLIQLQSMTGWFVYTQLLKIMMFVIFLTAARHYCSVN